MKNITAWQNCVSLASQSNIPPFVFARALNIDLPDVTNDDPADVEFIMDLADAKAKFWEACDACKMVTATAILEKILEEYSVMKNTVELVLVQAKFLDNESLVKKAALKIVLLTE